MRLHPTNVVPRCNAETHATENFSPHFGRLVRPRGAHIRNQLDGRQLLEKRAEKDKRERLEQEGKKVPPLLEPPSSNILLLGRSPLQHMLYTLRKIPASELEEALLVLPFDGVNHLINFLSEMIRERMQVELVARVLFFVLRIHQQQIVSNHALRDHIEHLKSSVREQLENHRDTLGFNISGIKYIQRVVGEKYIKVGGDDDGSNKRSRLF